MKLPKQIEPFLQVVQQQIQHHEFEFWKSDDPGLIDQYTALAHQIVLSGIDTTSLPRGYYLVATIFEWELSCQMSGWHALENRTESINTVTEAFRTVGLEAEADAVSAAAKAWIQSGENDDTAGTAYASIPNEYRKDYDRWAYLIRYFHQHRRPLFYLPHSEEDQ